MLKSIIPSFLHLLMHYSIILGEWTERVRCCSIMSYECSKVESLISIKTFYKPLCTDIPWRGFILVKEHIFLLLYERLENAFDNIFGVHRDFQRSMKGQVCENFIHIFITYFNVHKLSSSNSVSFLEVL